VRYLIIMAHMFVRRIGNIIHKLSPSLHSNEVITRCLATKAVAKTAGHATEKPEDEVESEPRHKRRQPPRIPLYGIHPVELCLTAKRRKLFKLYVGRNYVEHPRVQRIIAAAENRNVPVKEVGKYKLQMMCDLLKSNSMAGSIVHQGVVLHASKLPVPLWNEDMSIYGKSDSQQKLAVFLDKVQDPMNMGAIVRSCVFLGIDMIFVPSEGSCYLSPVVSKASSGALELANIYTVDKNEVFFGFLKSLNWDILGTAPESTPYSSCPKSTVNRLIVLGNEGHGVNDELSRFFTTKVSIPSASPEIDSLNVSVATGVLLSHFRKPVEPV